MLTQIELLPETTIAAAAANVLGEVVTDLFGMKTLGIEANFLHGSGGATLKVWIQTSLNGGANWIDIANFAFTTTAARKVIVLTAASVASFTPLDAALADDAVQDGVFGDRLRVKYTSTGTYAGATSIEVNIVPGS